MRRHTPSLETDESFTRILFGLVVPSQARQAENH